MTLPRGIHDREYQAFEECDGKVTKRVTICNTSDISNNSTIEQEIAGENISGVKAIYKDVGGVFLANNNVDLSQASVIGITRTAATIGNSINYQIIGKFYDSSLAFTVNEQIYLDINGNLTNIAPITGFRVLIGTAIDGGIQINIDEPIQL